MKHQQLKMLLNNLNEFCAKALEAGAAFAQLRQHYQISIDHVLIKMMEEGSGEFERVLRFFVVDKDGLWQAALNNLASQRAGNQGKPGFSPLILQWLERAWLSTNLYYTAGKISSVALIDSLVEIAATLPGDFAGFLDCISLDKLRNDFEEIVKGADENKKPSVKHINKEIVAENNEATALKQFTEDVTQKAQNNKIDTVLGRDHEIRLMIDILSRRRKNNPLLVGDPGVGKTAIVEGLALRIAAKQVPEHLKNVRLHTLDLGLLQAGAGMKGEFENRLKQVIEEVKSSPVPIIIFIDEAHTLIGAGGDAGMRDAANLLKPALARGELRTVAATTWAEYKKYFERDAALERRFQMVKVDEPSLDQAIVMLNGLKKYFAKHHDVLITDSAIDAAVRLSDRYINGRFLPDKAIDLLDTAATRIRMGQQIQPSNMDTCSAHIAYLESRIAEIEAEIKQGVNDHAGFIDNLTKELQESKKELEGLTNKWLGEHELVEQINLSRSKNNKEAVLSAKNKLIDLQQDNPLVQSELNEAAIAAVVADWTGIPVGNMYKDDMLALMNFEERIAKRVIGQNQAIAELAKSIRITKAGLNNPQAPNGVFLLTGPSGVGKTETARAIAEELFGGERFLISINMSEYQEAHTVAQLKGSPPGYVGYGEGGVLTEAVRQRPYSVVLLDEVEKAHSDVMNLFYQVFDRGFMRDGEGREIDFSNTIILMTANIGAATVINAMTSADKPSYNELRELIHEELLQIFAPALLARMRIIPFLNLEQGAMENIVRLKLDAVAKRIQDAHNMQLNVQPEFITHLATNGANTDSGARFINARIDRQILPIIAHNLLQFMVDDDMPGKLNLAINADGNVDCVFV